MAKSAAKKNGKRPTKVVSSDAEGQDTATTKGQSKTVSPVEGVKEMEINQMMEEKKDEEEPAIEIKGSTTTVTVSWEKTTDEGKGTNASDQLTVKESGVNGKRKAESSVEASPSKKTKLINDGFCIFVGNLNHTKAFQEVKDSLANYFMTQSLLVQEIRLDRSKKHAHVDLASEMDVTKALTLNGETVLDKPMKIAKAKVKTPKEAKVKVTPLAQKAKDAKCLSVKNLPYTATKADILKLFGNAVDVRFPGGTEGPVKGTAFLEFKSETVANKAKKNRQGLKIQGRVLFVGGLGESPVAPKVSKPTNDENNTKAAAPPNNTLFVSNLPFRVKEINLTKIFPDAVIKIPDSKGKSRGYAFVEFPTVADAEKALNSSQNTKILKRPIRVQFYEIKEKPEKRKVLTKTLIVMGLAEKTTAETLKSVFEGCQSARVPVDKEKGVSKGFGFVEFESEETCQAVKEAMKDCEIDGNKVTVASAKMKAGETEPGVKGGSAAVEKPAVTVAGRQGKHKKRGKKRRASKTKDEAKQEEMKV